MGILNKIKNILFEDDEEIEESMPVFTKEEKKEVKRETRAVEPEVVKVEEEPIKVTTGSRFKNVKRDIDLSFDEKDVLDEVTNVMAEPVVQQEEVAPVTVKVEEKRSPFPSFDEAEFDRLNSRINKNEEKARNNANARNNSTNTRANMVHNDNGQQRRNNNFSSTSVNRDKYDRRGNLNVSSTNVTSGKKPFVPSPVISPVYGILDKNYKKTDIVDKKDSSVTRSERSTNKDYGNNIDVDLDMVRKKAYGDEGISEEIIPEIKEEELFNELTVEKDLSLVPEPEEEIEIPELNDNSVLDIANEIEEELNDETDLTDLILEDIKEVEPVPEVKEKSSPRVATVLEDLEKTSTLQILDDIEKELNAIKPISKTSLATEIEDEEDDDTLENDLFNLIDSMYEEGEIEND